LGHNSVGLGLDCDTLRVREASRGLAHANYQVAFLKALRWIKPLKLEISTEDTQWRGRYMWVLGMNARFIGGGTLVAPAALLDDGLMDVVLFDQMPPLRMLAYLPRVMRGTHAALPGITTFRCRKLVCAAETPIDYIAADGELYYQLAKEIVLECRPGAMQMLR
jgi:diacylglycerol kinase family enzyme